MYRKSLIQSIFNAGDVLKREKYQKDRTEKPETGVVW